MNQRPIYITASSPRGSSPPRSRILKTSTPAEVSTFSQSNLSFHPQTTTYYTPAPTTFHENPSEMFSLDQNDNYEWEKGIGVEMADYPLSSTLSMEHPAVAQADQMNAFIDTYFVEHEASTSHTFEGGNREYDEFDHVVPSAVDQDLEARKKEQRELERIERERKELDVLLQESNNGEVKLKKYREQRSKSTEAARSRYQRMSDAERKPISSVK